MTTSTATQRARSLDELPPSPQPPLADAVRGTAVVLGPALLVDAAVVASGVSLVRWLRGARPASRAARVLTAAGCALPFVYGAIIRPWHMRWGATDEDIRRPMLGDYLVPDPGAVSTRAITVHAPAGRVWRWIAQLGQDRGGFYSYTWLENLAGSRISNADAIRPEWQAQRRVGEVLHMGPDVGDVVAAYEPGRAMALRNWGTFEVESVSDDQSRVIVRTRGPRGRVGFLSPWLGELPHFIMERKMLLGIKERAEREFAGRPATDA